MESFFKTLKYEEVYLCEYKTLADVMNRLPYFIEEAYNIKRLHSALGCRPPDEFEELLVLKQEKEDSRQPSPSPFCPAVGVQSTNRPGDFMKRR